MHNVFWQFINGGMSKQEPLLKLLQIMITVLVRIRLICNILELQASKYFENFD